MLRIPILILLLTTMSQTTPAQPALYDIPLTTIDGQATTLGAYAGQVVLIVNVASRCGLTPQYADLQALYERYHEQGLVILGFPANNFAGQEPGDNETIAAFCQKNYGVSFPMFAKLSVKGPDRHPLYASLAEATGEQPGWNFHKYLIDRQGESVQSISSPTKVSDPAVVAAIEALLSDR
jgi:glutathione peroxidase